MILVPIVLVGVLLLLLRGRAKRKARLAGLEATKPVYQASPPGGRLGRLKDQRL